MAWLRVVSNLVSRVPIERILFPPRDKTKSLEEFAETMRDPVRQKMPPPEQNAPPTTSPVPETVPEQEIATACVPCAVGHFSTSAGLLNEAVRFKNDGMTSNELIDRVAKAVEEQNTLERVDLTPEKLRNSSEWERELAEEALLKSRDLRHCLETMETVDELEKAAADTAAYYRKLYRQWWKGRFAHLGSDKAQAISDRVALPDDQRITSSED